MEGNVRKRGKRWYYRFYISEKDGKRRQIERFGGKTRQEALNSLREALNLYHNAAQFLPMRTYQPMISLNIGITTMLNNNYQKILRIIIATFLINTFFLN